MPDPQLSRAREGDKQDPWGAGKPYFPHQLPHLTPHTSSLPQVWVTALQRTCPKDPSLPDLEPPFTWRSCFLVSPWSLFLSCLYALEFFLKGGDRERETRGLRWGVWGQAPVPGAPKRSASPHGTFHHGPGPWVLMACGGGSMFPPRASVPSPPGGRSALGQRPPTAEHVLKKPSWLQPHLTLQETDSWSRIPGLTHRGPQEPAIPVPALCHLPGSPR